MDYFGMDVHRKYTVYTHMNEVGEMLGQGRVPNERAAFQEVLAEAEGPAAVALEATYHWYYLYDLLEELTEEVHLAHPLKVRAIAEARIKTDKIDATVLAHLLRTNLLPEAYIPPRPVRERRELFRYLALAKVLQAQIAQASQEIRQVVTADPQAQLLTTVPGIGYYTALLILSEVGDLHRFPDARHLVSYAGLVPSVHASGDKVRYGRITKAGSRWLRWALVEAAHVAVRRPGALRSRFLRTARRKGEKAAVVAVARFMLKTVYQLLKQRQPYREDAGSS